MAAAARGPLHPWAALALRASHARPAPAQVHNKLFYLDADHFRNRELLLKLAPVQAAAHAVAEADEQREREGKKQEGGAA